MQELTLGTTSLYPESKMTTRCLILYHWEKLSSIFPEKTEEDDETRGPCSITTLLMCLLYQHFIENALKASLWILLKIQNILKAYPESKKEKGTYTHLLTRYHN